MRLSHYVLGLISCMLLTPTAYAICNPIPKTMNVADVSIATPVNIPNFNISDSYLQPGGTLLGSTVIPATDNQRFPPDTVLWTCDKVDLTQIYFLVATNGYSPFNGRYDVGAKDGLDNAFSTYWQYVGARFTVGGIAVNTIYQRVNLNNYATNPKDSTKIDIRLKDLPTVEASVYRVSSLPSGSGGSFHDCGQQARSGAYKNGCRQWAMAIQLGGVPMGNFADIVNDDSVRAGLRNTSNGIGYSFYTGQTVATNSKSCVARNTGTTVTFPPVIETSLTNGQTVDAGFQVILECNSKDVLSGTKTGNFAIGFQPSAAAADAAQRLNLNNQFGSSNYLLSDGYDSNPNSAKGVGIQVEHVGLKKGIRFLNKNASPGGNAEAGWYGVLEGAKSEGEVTPGFTRYTQDYKATLTALPGGVVTAGKVKSTATVIVKIQ